MQKKGEISDYRTRLDKTLISPELTGVETLRNLIRKQLCLSCPREDGECNGDILDKRTADVSNVLDKLRSASSVEDHGASRSSETSSYGDWKLKGDYEDCRVMYREGLQGSPFHTLLVEGYVDGPVEDCLCVSWESSLYKKWWPQSLFPSFKVVRNTCLQKVGIGEQICLVRMKVPWPMSDREAVVHYFLFEYFKDGLIIVLINTISDLESIGFSSKDFTENCIPEALNAVRIDVVGGFALQKVTPERSYFRTIAEMDIKFDLVPPSLINFISRQLVGNGFRLYKKAVDSVAKVDEDYSKALADPLYTRIRQALYSVETCEENEPGSREFVDPRDEIVRQTEGDEQNGKFLTKSEPDEERRNEMQDLPFSDVHGRENEPVHRRRGFSEIEEEECEESFDLKDGSEAQINGKRRFCVSPEVKQALGTLERAITMVRKYRTDTQGQSTSSSSSFSDGELPPNMAEDPPEQLVSLSENNGVLNRVSHESHNDGSSMHMIRIAPASSEQDIQTSTTVTDAPETGYLGQTAESDTQTRTEKGETHDTIILKNPMLRRRHRVCCFAFKSRN
ncbi:PREDICTED: uncharacterized protein LOC104826799 isoform X2 [Tarenaya hassleriana]|uniref:uncharacterized protein LOC104826799 isoform X2 n=1 Tax=Tarenaya hassleriana TaxID=28532 RepID=UPI00053C5D76|nr:PREDICTED: uncharacterized protein LOC104826799 isoform X2 [Tarenaya hassleriana]XP_019059758.1 PREDICTED: uncharacterized protein LOC104826799 isoform X2 [Tarenaya hassleriana]